MAHLNRAARWGRGSTAVARDSVIMKLPRHYGFTVDSRESGETVVLRTVGSSVSHRT